MNKKNIVITVMSVLILTCLFAFARTTTTDLGLVKPVWTENVDILDDINANSDILEAFANDVLAYDLSPVLRANLDISTFNIEGVDATEFGYLDGISAYGGTLIDDADASAARTTLGLVIGTNIQAYDATLLSIAALGTAADKIAYTTNVDTWAETALTAFGRSIIDDADEATFKGTVNLEIGTDVQAYDAQLADIAALAVTDSNFIVGNGTNWVAESGATARTSLGLAIGTNVQAYDAALTSISALTYASPSFIKLTDNDTYAVRTLTETKIDLDVDDLEAVNNYTDSPMIVTGGAITVGTNAGTFKVAALTALLRATDSAVGALTYKTLAVQDNQAITAANTFYYIVLNYAGTPTITIETSMPNNTTNIYIGSVMKDASNNVHFISSGLRLQDGVAKLHRRAKTLRQVELDGGSAIAYSGTNNFTMETGYAFSGINLFEMASYDSATTTFTPVYQNGSGGWTEGAESNVIDFAHYDDGDGTLGDVGVAKYGTHWVYRHADDSHVYVVYGRDSYSLAAAEAEGEPTRPTHLTNFGALIGKIVAPQAGGSFAAIQMVTETFFTGTAVSNHANLSNLDYAAAGHTGFAATADLHTQNTDTDLDATFEATFGKHTDKLSAFAATTSAELAGVISNEIGAGKLRFDTAVTAKTTTATLNVNEAGTILCSAAGGAYTITLPTAVGNMGLTYHFIKTDANYTLITIDGDGTETINYENATGAPTLTYVRLNTYCAEATLVSDNANWQCINERLGQVPMCHVYSNALQEDFTDATFLRVELNTETYNIGNNFDISTWVSGNATSTSANHLVDTGGAFTAAMVNTRVKNTTDTTYTYITAYNSVTDVTVRNDIFVNTEGYEIKKSRFVAPVSGYYNTIINLNWVGASVIVDKRLGFELRKDGTEVIRNWMHTSVAKDIHNTSTTNIALSKDAVITLYGYSDSGANTVDLWYGASNTFLQIKLVSKY